MNVEILYTAWNRLEFTRTSFELLKRNTNWERVERLVVYDDGSEDGTYQFLQTAGRTIPVPAYEVRKGGWRSTGATLNDFVAQTERDQFVKIDNDICLPPGWLDHLLGFAADSRYELIGMEAGWEGVTRHIGGVGLMRTDAFVRRRPVPLSLGKNGRAGFTIWQHRHHVLAGWLEPPLPVVQLDRLPGEPWRQLAAHYVKEGWSRPWDPYELDMKEWWEWLPKDIVQSALRRSRSRSSRT